MQSMYEQGQTLKQIGERFGVSRERVRQILSQRGIDGRHGGRTIRTAQKEAAEALRQEKSSRLHWDIPAQLRDELRAKYGPTTSHRSPFRAYIAQRRNARVRGIAWEFTFATWWDVWVTSGKWELRGRWTGYEMARYGDVGPYSPSNIYICDHGQNIRDYYKYRRK